MNELDNSEFEEEFDLVLLAMGFVHPVHRGIINQSSLKKDSRGNIKIDDGFKTSIENIFAAGDASMGASLVVRAIYQGREAAESIHEYLSEK
jgi:glutamate synthase (NADPH/NADH) small chain